MKISKLTAAIKLLTGGVAGLVEYILDKFNEFIQTLPATEVAKYAQVAKDIAVFIQNLANTLITDTAKKNAANLTALAVADLATSLLDSKLTREELDTCIEAVKVAVEAWKAAK